ncbi:MAG: FixH family protein [Actinobacteria bacterium]|nr:FixH family protein [Actinomycetota bacterium]
MSQIRGLSIILFLAVLVGLFAGSAVAHEGGKAQPRISAQANGTGFNRTLIVRLNDLDTGDPISGATVKVRTQMTRPHVMTLIPRTIPERAPQGTYSIPYTFVMPGDWEAEFEVTGAKVISAKASLAVPVAQTPLPPGETTRPPQALPTRLETEVTGRDWVTMAVLWVHGLASLGWIVGVIVMAIALSVPPLLREGTRGAISAWYRGWGAWAHWAAVPLIVATGIYNIVYVTPFKLAVTPDAIDNLSNIAYGRTYEAILLVKLALFVVLLLTGTTVLVRTIQPRPLASGLGPVRMLVAALGPAGIVYLATVPLILAAAMALRYIHILSHVAEVINT